jgi:hypothetical protein
MASECKSESGQHEANFEELGFICYIGADSVLMRTTCLHCDATAEFTIYESDADWIED